MSEVYRICRHGVVQHPSRPGPDHHIVVTTIDGSRVAMHPVCDFDRAIKLAIDCANLKHDRSIAVKVRCWHIRDLCLSLGIDPKALRIGIDEVAATAKRALLDSQEPAVRREAYDLLVKLGAFQWPQNSVARTTA